MVYCVVLSLFLLTLGGGSSVIDLSLARNQNEIKLSRESDPEEYSGGLFSFLQDSKAEGA